MTTHTAIQATLGCAMVSMIIWQDFGLNKTVLKRRITLALFVAFCLAVKFLP